MAQMQPISGGKIEPMSDVVYDLATVLSNCGEAVDALNQYINDAKSANDQDALRLFEQLRDDEIRHCDMTRSLISKLAKQGAF